MGPARADESWALGNLLQGEQTLWRRMSGPDRRHAVGVARDSISLLGSDDVPPEVVSAALLHDVGKVESSFGTMSRAVITFAAIGFGRARLLQWADQPGKGGRRTRRARVGLYLTHDSLGAEMLKSAGSKPLTVSWAAEHHLPPEMWTVDATVGAALKAADGD